jgi:DNA-binding CsgD family transcriptional regulator
VLYRWNSRKRSAAGHVLKDYDYNYRRDVRDSEIGPPKALSDLTDRERIVIEMRCVNELSRKESAEAMGIQDATIRTHSTTILRKLRKLSFYGVCMAYGEDIGRMSVVSALRPEAV